MDIRTEYYRPNSVKFVFKKEEYKELCSEAQVILRSPNAGGSSVRSEAYAMQFLKLYFGAESIKDEMKVKYFHEWWKKCDFITRLSDGHTSFPIGVSVTRAVFPKRGNPDNLDLQVSKLLWKKLSGLVVARAGLSDDSIFEKCLLFVWTPDEITSNLVYYTFHYLTDLSLKEDVILVIVEADHRSLITDFR